MINGPTSVWFFTMGVPSNMMVDNCCGIAFLEHFDVPTNGRSSSAHKKTTAHTGVKYNTVLAIVSS